MPLELVILSTLCMRYSPTRRSFSRFIMHTVGGGIKKENPLRSREVACDLAPPPALCSSSAHPLLAVVGGCLPGEARVALAAVGPSPSSLAWTSVTRSGCLCRRSARLGRARTGFRAEMQWWGPVAAAWLNNEFFKFIDPKFNRTPR